MPAQHLHLTRRRLLGAAAGLLTLPVACTGSGQAEPVPTRVTRGAERPFLMGLSSLPADTTGEAYEEAFALAGRSGDLVLIQRAPPWAEFMAGGTISNRTERLTRVEIDLARRNNLRLFLAIDPTDPGFRGSLAGVPEGHEGKDFTDGALRASLVAYAKYLALNYKPDYLAVGVEVDLFYAARGDAAFRNFQSLYFEAYDAVKSVSRDTLVFPTFQFENMNGALNPASRIGPVWSLVSRFEPKYDMLAVSSFPNAIFPIVSQLPENYYGQLRSRSDRPVALASIGWSSASKPGDIGEEGKAEQTEYMNRALKQAEDAGLRMVVWYLGQDRKPQPALPDSLAGMGLYDHLGEAKDSSLRWQTVAERPAPQS